MADLVLRLRHLEPSNLVEFRKHGKYNNLMYTTAGWLLEKLARQDWFAFLQTYMLNPIGMRDTTCTVDALQAATEYAAPYLGSKAMRPKDVSSIAAAGARTRRRPTWRCSSSACFAEAWARMAAGCSRPLRIEEQFQPLTPIEWRGVMQHYSLGWFVADVGGRRIVHHTGASDGYSTIVAMMPDEGLGVCVLVNQHASLLPDCIAHQIIGALAGLPTGWRVFGDCERADPLGLGSLASALLPGLPALMGTANDPLAGSYSDPGYGDMVISRDREGLWLQWCTNRWALQRIPPWVFPLFRIQIEGYGRKQTVPIWIRRERGGGRSFALPLEREVDPVRFYRR